jgi:hypothetical protein
MSPAVGFEVLREVSQHTNMTLHLVAERVIGWALGQGMPPSVGQELEAAVQRRSREQDAPDAEATASQAVALGPLTQGACRQAVRACSTVGWQGMTLSRPTS